MLSYFPNAGRRRKKARENDKQTDETGLQGKYKPAIRTLMVRVAAVVLYLCFGALIFCAIEHREKDKTFWKRKLEYVKKRYGDKYNMSARDFTELEQIIRNRIKEAKDEDKGWDYYQSLYFSSTVTTTIGYGHITPQTQGGRIFLIVFALIGIPLNILALASVGEHISIGICHLIYRISKDLCRKKKVQNINIKVMIVSIVLMIIMLFVGGALYCFTEDWTYVDSIYYCFVALATIGFGDLVPNNGKAPDSSYEKGLWFLRTMYISIGLSLVSTVFTSISNAMEEINAVMGWVKRSEKYKSTKNVLTGCNGHGKKATAKDDKNWKECSTRSKTQGEPDNPYESNRQTVQYEKSKSVQHTDHKQRPDIPNMRCQGGAKYKHHERTDLTINKKYPSSSQVYEEVDALSVRSNASNVYLYDWTSGGNKTLNKHGSNIKRTSDSQIHWKEDAPQYSTNRAPSIERRHPERVDLRIRRHYSSDRGGQTDDLHDIQEDAYRYRKGYIEFKGKLKTYETISDDHPYVSSLVNRPSARGRHHGTTLSHTDLRSRRNLPNDSMSTLTSPQLECSLGTEGAINGDIPSPLQQPELQDLHTYDQDSESGLYEVPFTTREPHSFATMHASCHNRQCQQQWNILDSRQSHTLPSAARTGLHRKTYYDEYRARPQNMHGQLPRQPVSSLGYGWNTQSLKHEKPVAWDEEYSIERQISDFAFHSRRSEPEGAADSPNGTITRTFQNISNSIEERWKSETVQGILDLAQSVYLRTLEQRGKNSKT